MKVINTNPKREPVGFPRVVKFPDGTMALMISSGTGFCIFSGTACSAKEGDLWSDWIEENGKPWHGTVTLEF